MVNLICLCSFVNFSIFFHSFCLFRPASASSSPRHACNLAKTLTLLHVCLIFSLVIAFLIHNSQLNSISRGAYWIYGASFKVAPWLNEFTFLRRQNLWVLNGKNSKWKTFLRTSKKRCYTTFERPQINRYSISLIAAESWYPGVLQQVHFIL